MMKIRVSKQWYALLGYLLVMVILCWPSRFAARYDFVKHSDILGELVEKVTKNISASMGSAPKCEYHDLIEENLYMYRLPFTEQVVNNYNILMGMQCALQIHINGMQ